MNGKKIEWLDVIPALWLALAGAAYGVLGFNTQDPDRGQLPLAQFTEAAVVPALCVLVVAAIIRCYCLRDRPSPQPPVDRGLRQDSV